MTKENEKITLNPQDLIDVDAITKRVAAKLEEDIANSVCWQIKDITTAKVLELMEPEIEKIISAQKQTIIDGVTKSIPAISKAISERMIASAINNLDGYRGKDILKQLLD